MTLHFSNILINNYTTLKLFNILNTKMMLVIIAMGMIAVIIREAFPDEM